MNSQTAEWQTERKRLQDLLVKTALDLAVHTGTAAFSFQLPHTTPPLHVAVGEAAQIRRLVGA